MRGDSPGRAIGLRDQERRQWVAHKIVLFDTGQIEAGLDELRAHKGRGKKRVGQLLKHLTRFKDALGHDEIRAAGLPVGSGEVESAHRTIPQRRLKLPGAWWRPDTVNKMLGLRVLRANGWWDAYWGKGGLTNRPRSHPRVGLHATPGPPFRYARCVGGTMSTSAGHTSRSITSVTLAALVALAAPGCIRTPSAEAHQSGSIALEGLTTEPNQEVAFYRLDRREAEPDAEPLEHEIGEFLFSNQGGGVWSPLRARTGTRPRFLRLFEWSTTIPSGVMLPTNAWIPQDPAANFLPTSLGRVEIAAYPLVDGVRGARLRTRSNGFDDDTFVAFDNDGVGLTATPVVAWEGTGPRVRAPREPGDTSGPLEVEIESGNYVVAGVGIPVEGVMCHPVLRARDAPLRTVIYNHGGLDVGVSGFDLRYCVAMARRGWRVAMSAYRYQGVTRDLLVVPGAIDLPPEVVRGRPPGETLSEFCLGEVADVLRWTEIIRARGDTDDGNMLMMGGSHGGCVTLRAVEQGAQVRGAIALAPPTDFPSGYRRLLGEATDRDAFIADWGRRYGFGPDDLPPPGSLEGRSPARMAVDLSRRSDVRVLIAAALGDRIVFPSQSCLLARVLETTNHFLNPTGVFLATGPPASACNVFPSGWAARPPEPGWPDQRYFLLYQAADGVPGWAIHGAVVGFAPWDMTMTMMDSPVDDFITSLFGPPLL